MHRLTCKALISGWCDIVGEHCEEEAARAFRQNMDLSSTAGLSEELSQPFGSLSVLYTPLGGSIVISTSPTGLHLAHT